MFSCGVLCARALCVHVCACCACVSSLNEIHRDDHQSAIHHGKFTSMIIIDSS